MEINRIGKIFCVLIILIFVSCKKEEGEGGLASIKGKIWTEDWNSTFTVLQAEYPSADVDVYIIYGDDISYSERQFV
ncbi:MAG: hypothetical protein HUU47_03625 [Bacteroidetes bacterium]|nr:hypothetical protein [Bacteroidota bacterium]